MHQVQKYTNIYYIYLIGKIKGFAQKLLSRAKKMKYWLSVQNQNAHQYTYKFWEVKCICENQKAINKWTK